MTNLRSLLHQFLIENTYLLLPNIGVLKFSYASAQLDIANKQIVAPKKYILLEKIDTYKDSEGLIISFLSRYLKIEKSKAENAFNQFIGAIQSKLSTDKIYHWQGLGSFIQNNINTISFQQDEILDQYWPSVLAERIARPEVEHSITVGNTETTNIFMKEYLAGQEKNALKDYWWIWALIILVASAVLIYFQFKNQDFF